MARKIKQHYSIDFEATTDPKDCRVWAYGIMNIYDFDDYHMGIDIVGCMKFMENNNGDYYFHNLKYDGKFIIDYLLKNGFEHTHEKLQPKHFTTVIADSGAWYTIEIFFGFKGKQEKRVKIFCSLKKLPFSVKRIAQAFKLPILKGEIDYHKPREIGYTLDDNEKAYLKNDVEIIARALRIQFDEGQKKITIGSDSLNAYKTSIGGSKRFKQRYPLLPVDVDAEIRKAYRGGFTWVNPTFQGQQLGEGIVYDVNSLYPSEMYNKPLPYGLPKSFDGEYLDDENYPLYIQRVRCEFDLKEGYIPTVQIKNSRMFTPTDYLETTNGEPALLYMTNQDMELLFEHYDVDMSTLEYLGGFKFKSMTGSFTRFIDHWSQIKANSTGAIRELAKLILNNLYGKFASNPNVTRKVPVLVGDKVRYVTGENESKDPIYTAVGVFITSYARHTTITTAQKCFDRIIYCDTDSIHLLGTDEPDINIHQSDLGAWKYEGTFKRGKFLRAKTYMEELYMEEVETENGKILVTSNAERHTTTLLNIKVAGLPENAKQNITFDNFKPGFIADGKIMPVTVPGGTVFKEVTFTIK